jgi:DNA-binding NarL/FixJ family response regulator
VRTAPLPVCLADRYDGVRVALREVLQAAGLVRVVAEVGTVAQARAAAAVLPPGGVLVVGLTFPDGTAEDLLAVRPPVVVYSWLPADERGVDLAGAAAVIGVPLVPGITEALRALAVP